MNRAFILAALMAPAVAFGEAVQTVAYWDRDFETAEKGVYRTVLGAGTTLNDDGTVTLAQQTSSGVATKGIEIRFFDEGGVTAFEGRELTVIVRYSGLKFPDGRVALLSALWGNSSGSSEVVLFSKDGKKVSYATDITSGSSSITEKDLGTVSETIPVAGMMLVSLSGTQDGNNGCKGTRLAFAPSNGDGTYGDFVEYGFQSGLAYTDRNFYGIKVGGTVGSNSAFSRPAMVVEAVAVVKGFTTTARTFRYFYPDECRRFDYAGTNPTADTKFLDTFKVKDLKNAAFSAKSTTASMAWVGGMVTACQKKYTPNETSPTAVAVQYQVRNVDYDKSADITFTDISAGGVNFKKTGGHYNAIAGDVLGSDDASWSNASTAYNFNDFSIYVPYTKRAKIAGTRSWTGIPWFVSGTPTADDWVQLNPTAAATVTIDAASAVTLVKVLPAAAKVTFKYSSDKTKLLTARYWDFSEATGKVALDCSAMASGTAVTLMSGKIWGIENIDVAASRIPSGTRLIITESAVSLATVAVWTNASGDGNIQNKANWQSGTLPFSVSSSKITFKEDVSFAADADWSAVTITSFAKKTFDLRGHTLKIASLITSSSYYGTFTDTTEDTTKPGSFVIDIPSGKTWNNSYFVFTGNLRFVKEGAGTYSPRRKQQLYTGGTVVSNGVVSAYLTEADLYLGAVGSDIVVEPNGTFDNKGKYEWTNHRIVLNGGTLLNTGGNMTTTSNNGLGDIVLTADSTMQLKYHMLFNDKNVMRYMDLGGHTLAVECYEGTASAIIHTLNSTWRNGTVTLGPGVVLRPYAEAVFEKDLTLVSNGDLQIYKGDKTFGNLIDNSEGTHDDYGSVSTVLGTYKPISAYLHSTEMGDGSTLDLADVTGAWTFQSKEGKNQKFTYGDNAVVTVALGDRRDVGPGSLVVTWTERPNATFRLSGKAVETMGLVAVIGDDGLYLSVAGGLVIGVR